jgi:probable F420-dependent oxidoreductase
MKFGISMFPTDYAIPPAQLARALEDRGFEALIFPEHTHIPSSRLTPFPSGGELPKQYSHALDPFVALGAAFAVTTRLKIGTGVCLVIERDPIVLAKEVASADHLSGGRFLFGVGGGWNREEMENHGTDFTHRWKRLRESVEAMKEIWGQDRATYHGDFVNFDAIWSWPKPVQRPHPPILVGGNGARTLQRVVRYGDEWMPLHRGDGAVAARIPELRELAAQAGRGEIPVSLVRAPHVARELEALHKAGVGRFFFSLAAAPADTILPQLDQLQQLTKELG